MSTTDPSTTDPSTTAVPSADVGPADDLSRVRYARVGGIDLAYETFGDPADPPILLVMGLGAQMIAWPEELCGLLADAGHHVIRFDNRDAGLSTHVDHPAPTLPDLLRRRPPPYTVSDMAHDALGLLDHLEVERAHVVGASMGGFISQTLALARPERVRSLSLVMTSTGSRRVGQASPKVLQRMAKRPVAPTRDAAIDEAVRTYRLIGSRPHSDEQLVRQLAARSYDRCYDPAGTQRQLAAVVAQPNRTSELRRLSMPTLVVHGLDDPLVAASGGLAIARSIPGATFIGHSGMGHDLPRSMWRTLAADVLSVIDRAGDG